MYGGGKTVELQLRLQYITHIWSMEIDSPVPCGTESRTGICDWESVCHVKSRACITSCMSPRTPPRHPWDPILTPTHLHLRTTCAVTHRKVISDRIWRKMHVNCRTKQGLGGKQETTKKERWKDTIIYISTVAYFFRKGVTINFDLPRWYFILSIVW